MTGRETLYLQPRTRTTKAAPPSSQISTVLVDDHKLIRQCIRCLLQSEGDIAIVGEAQNGRQAVEMVLRLRPDVVVMDIAMPLLNGIEATRQILEAAPQTHVVIMSGHDDEEYVERVSDLGAEGYVLKQSSVDDLAAAIRTVGAGKTFVSVSISPRLRDRIEAKRPPPGEAPERTKLTCREAEVLQLIAEGKSNKGMAHELRISVKTVEKHRQGLMTKLDIHDIAGLTRYSIAVGSIEGRDGFAKS